MTSHSSTPAQKAFFETFGYIHLPGLMIDDIGWIIDEYEAVWRSRTDVHTGVGAGKATSFPGLFVSMTPRLSVLIEHPRIRGICDLLFGDAWSVTGGDASIFDGETPWHPDGDENIVRHAKVAFYLERLTRETGALRVIPGTHFQDDRFNSLLKTTTWDPRPHFGISGAEIPSVALETQPGDVVIFDHRIKHASFGGGVRRRMMNINIMESIRTDAQREAALKWFRHHRDNGGKWGFDPKWVATAPPERLCHLRNTIELGAKVMGEVQPTRLLAPVAACQ